jgi:predicted transcriptional regulator of viral defense system
VEYIPYINTECTMKTSEFFATRPVFSLDEAARILAPPGGRTGTIERLKHHLQTGRLQLVSRGIYAVLPAGLAAGKFQPDPVFVAAAIRPDGIFSHHSALEILGTAQSMWNKCTLYTSQRRRSLKLDSSTLCFLDHPSQFKTSADSALGTRRIERRGQILRTTGPERTLVEGFRRPALVGGFEELINSAATFQVFDLHLLESILRRYNIANLWAATGWFLARHQKDFHVPEDFLTLCEKNRPKSPQYLERNNRTGRLSVQWNLIIPQSLNATGEANES